jgi:hypothetical protein
LGLKEILGKDATAITVGLEGKETEVSGFTGVNIWM